MIGTQRERASVRRVAAAATILVGAVLAVLPFPMAMPAARAISAAVLIDSSGFHPSVLRIVVGQAVVFTNADNQQHSVTSLWPGARPTPTPTPASPASVAPTPIPAPLFDLVLEPGGSDTLTFSETGSFDYYCREHPGETGVAYVFAEALQTPSPSPSPSLPDAAYLPLRRPAGMPMVALGLVLMMIGTLLTLASGRDETTSDRRSRTR